MIWRLLPFLFMTVSAGATESCFMTGQLQGDPAYFWTWARDSWMGTVKVFCHEDGGGHRATGSRYRDGNFQSERDVRFISWGPGQGAGRSSQLSFTVIGLNRAQLDSLMGTFRYALTSISAENLSNRANIAIENNLGLLIGQLEENNLLNSNIRRWLSTGQITILPLKAP